MRKITLLLIVFIFCKDGFTQCDSLYFRTTATLLQDVLLLDTSRIIAVGDNGYMIRSSDGGRSWRSVPTFEPYTLNAIYQATDSVLYTVGTWKTILKSEDQGGTWYPLHVETKSTFSTPTAGLNDVFFLSKDRGYIVSDEAVLYSTNDGGRTWKDTLFSTIGSSRLYSVTFVNDTLGFIGGGGSTIFRTKNGGSIWEKINIDFVGFNKAIYKIKFLSASTGFAVGENNICIMTTDGGTTWSSVTVPFSGSNYRDIDFFDAQTGFIVAADGMILKTVNGGNSWNIEQGVSYFNSGYALALDKGRGKMVFVGGGGFTDVFGYNGRSILSTSDKGSTYQQWSANPRLDYHALFFINDSTGFLAGDVGSFLKTTDYGESWKRLANIPTLLGGNSTRSLFFLNEQEGYAASDRLYKTSDGGSSWNLTTIPGGDQQVFLNRMYFFNNQKGVVMDNYHIYRTTDGGVTWATVFTAPSILRDLCFRPDGTGFAVGYSHQSYVSIDQGVTWSSFPVSSSEQLTGVYFYNNNIGFIGTSDSVLYKTTDGGASWNWINTDIHRVEMRSFLFVNDSLGYMMISNGFGTSGIAKTKDGGKSWKNDYGAIENFTPLSGFKEIYVAGGSGFIAKTDHRYSPSIPGYIYGYDINCQNKKSSFITGPLTGVNFNWTLSGGGNNTFKQNLDTVLWNAPGNYTLSVTASNVCGTSPQRQLAITVNPVTAITTQPVSMSVCIGTPVTFTVNASGVSLNYQWQKSGLNIPGANSNAYSIPSVDSSYAGDYSVTVNGLCGSVYSSVAKLTVLSQVSCTTAVLPVSDYVQTVLLMPNPVNSNTVLKITATQSTSAQFELIDMNGKPLQRFNLRLSRGENKFNLSFPAIAPGVYQLRGISSNKKVLTVVRFIKL